MMQGALFYCDLWKQKNSLWRFPFPNIATSSDRTEQSFQAGCFNLSQMKASVELCITKLSDTAAKSELKADWERIVNYGNLERWMV